MSAFLPDRRTKIKTACGEKKLTSRPCLFCSLCIYCFVNATRRPHEDFSACRRFFCPVVCPQPMDPAAIRCSDLTVRALRAPREGETVNRRPPRITTALTSKKPRPYGRGFFFAISCKSACRSSHSLPGLPIFPLSPPLPLLSLLTSASLPLLLSCSLLLSS